MTSWRFAVGEKSLKWGGGEGKRGMDGMAHVCVCLVQCVFPPVLVPTAAAVISNARESAR